jgi:gliding motility-associated-like protein
MLTVSNAGGSNTKTVTNYITVKASPTVSFTGDSSVSCAPKTIAFNNLTNPNAPGSTNYLWDFGDGGTSTSVNPSHTYTTSGNFNVTLVATNSLGCNATLTKTGYIPIPPMPVASFSSTNNNNCVVPATVNFQNNSLNAVSYDWSFGDGGTSTATSPSHQYLTAGSYTVRLIATSAIGCKDTFTQSAYVNLGTLNAAFTTSNTNTCINTPVTFTNTTTPAPTAVTWYFGNGNSATTTNATFAYPAAGTYNVMMVAQLTGCNDTAYQTVVVNPKPVSQFNANQTIGCSVPFNVQFTNTSTGATSYLWRFGDGTTSTSTAPLKTYNALGTYNVTLISYSAAGCTDTLVKTAFIEIKTLDSTNLGINATVTSCAPATVTFNAFNNFLSSGTYAWNFGDMTTQTCACQVVSHLYASAGTYTVSVNYNPLPGCSATRHVNVTIQTKPTAAFSSTPNTICPKKPVTFTNTSVNATSYLWLFGDGDSSTATNPTHIYGTTGTYTVRLVARNSACADTLTLTNHITVNLPTASFTSSFNCNNRKQFTFTDNSVGANTYSWNFGDGNTSTTAGTVSHTYTNFGSYVVRLVVTNTSTGCTDTFLRTVVAFPIVADYTTNKSTACKNEGIFFNAVYDTNYTNFAWTMGNSATATLPSFWYNYSTLGTYNVKLVITDIQGCKDSVTKPIVITGPVASFTGTPVGGCSPLNVNFTDNSTSGAGVITNRNWNWGDAQQTNTLSTSLSHLYSTNGSFTVKLTLTDALGCVDSMVKVSYINTSKPIVAFTTSDTTVCKGLDLAFINLSTGTGITYLWDFGDGNTSTAFGPIHNYAATGSYNVKLVITDINNCKDSVVKLNHVDVYALNLGFAASDTVEPCPPLAVNFTNSSSGVSSYTWTLGNGSNSTLTNPSTVYTYPGVYNVKMIGYSSIGCKDSVSKNITVYGPTGTLSYNPKNGCNPLTVNFTSTNNNTASLVWDMNNGFTQTTTASNFTYTYTQPGKYLPKLILSDNASCLVPITATDTIKVDDVQADFSFTPLSACGSGTIQFTDTVFTSLTNVSRQWDFGDMTTSTAKNPSHFYAAPGNYQVRLIINNLTGCDDTITKTVVIHALPNVTGGAAQSMCAGQLTPVTLQATGANTYTWTPATGLSCTNCANPNANPSATTTYVVTGTDVNGCTDTGSVIVTVHPLPNVTTSNKTTCAGTAVGLLATGGNTYTWTPATGLSCTNCANPNANPANTTTYTVTGTDANGCADTGIAVVTVNSLPNVSAGPNVAICTGNSTTLNASGANSYTWSPATGLSCTNCASPTANPVVTTTYTVTGVDANGCTNSATVTVTVNALPNVSGGPNKSICDGSSTVLNASGASSYTWSPATGLSCTNCASPTANPTTTTTYTVTGTSGCAGTANVTVTVNPRPTVSGGGNKVICAGSSTVLNASGAGSYTWSPGTGLSCTNCANPTATPTTTTTYTVTGTDANGCTNTDNVTVTVNPQPIVSGGANKTICSGTSTTLLATGANSYSWTPATGLSCINCANPTANPTVTTTYTVTGTDGNGCTNTATVTVNVNPLPNVSAGNNVAICSGSSTSLNVTGATSYSWTPATGLSCTTCQSPTANPSATTTYTVVGTDANGCIKSATVTVTVNPLPNVSAGSNQSICLGSSVTLNATGATTYSWTPTTGLSNPNISNPVASPTTTTIYTVTGTDANGCVKTATVTITVNPLPSVSGVADKTICAGSSTTISATGAATYSWSPATGLSNSTVANPIATPGSTTTYIVTGTSANGCTDTGKVTVTVNPLPTISGGGNQSICTGSSVQLNATGGTSYVWTPSTGLSCTTCPAPLASPSATATYQVAGTDANGCSNTDNVTVTVNPIPVVNASANKYVICDGTTALLQATGATTYTWSPALGLSNPNIANPVAGPGISTTYIVTGTTNGCSDTAVVMLKVLSKPNVNAGNDTAICIGASATLQASGTQQYTWSPATGLSCTNCTNPIANPTVTTVYTLTGRDTNECTNVDMVTVTVHQLPSISAGNDIELCNGDEARLNATGGLTYVWSPGTDLSCTKCPDPLASPVNNITYTVTGTDAFGCVNADDINITVKKKLPIDPVKGGEICRGDSIRLNATGGDTYLWIPDAHLSNTTIGDPMAYPTGTIEYKVVIKQGTCFADTASVLIKVNELPIVDAGPDQTVVNGSIIRLNAVGSNIAKYEWTPGDSLSCADCSTPVATPLRSTMYTVTVYSDAGCKSADSVTVFVGCDQNHLFVANTFTPNGDGLNDRFYPQGTGITHVERLRVYNRWGQLMFDGQNLPLNDPAYGWDGKYKNELLNPDVFVYILNAQCESGNPIEIKGDISLIR